VGSNTTGCIDVCLWCVVVCDIETPKNEESMTRVGSQRHRKEKKKVAIDTTVEILGVLLSIDYPNDLLDVTLH
jgi:hypothetical protein